MILRGVAIVIESKKYEYLLPENPPNYELNINELLKNKSEISSFGLSRAEPQSIFYY